MYERFFGLSANPFSMTPDPNLLFLTNSHREALAGLNYAILGRKGFVVLTGEAGTGKTTLLRKLLEMMPETEAQASVVLNPTLTASEFLELLLFNFGNTEIPPSKAQRLHVLERMLSSADKAGRTLVLVIDEAHKLNIEVLEEIRLLTNFETSERKLLQIVLSGQPELKDVLNRPELWQLKQRVAIRLSVGPLLDDELISYLQHRWARAGGEELPFSADAIARIGAVSRGIPRLVNAICDNALLIGFSGQRRDIDAAIIAEVELDLDLSPPDRAVPVAAKGVSIAEHHGMNGKAAAHSLSAHVANGENGTGSPARDAHESALPLHFGMLQRYMPREEAGFAGLRWVRKFRVSAVRES